MLIFLLNLSIFFFNPYSDKLIYLNFQPLDVVSHYRDPQPQVVENYLYLFNFRPNIYKSWYLIIQSFYSK